MRHSSKECGWPKKKGRIISKGPEVRVVPWSVSSANSKRELLGYAVRKEKADTHCADARNSEGGEAMENEV